MKLTDADCRNAKPRRKIWKLGDGGGLFLCVMPKGSKLWWVSYRFNGKQKTLSVGPYPTITLAAARSARERAKRQIKEGVDPSAAKIATKYGRQNSATTFNAVCTEFLARQQQSGLANTTMTKLRWLLSFPKAAFGEKQIKEIRPTDVIQVLKKLQERGVKDTAVRVRSTISAVFRTAIALEWAESDPSFALGDLLAAPLRKHRAAITEPAAFGKLLRAIDRYDGQVTTVAALQLMALLFCRPGELRKAEWNEFCLEEGVWIIPAARMKQRQEHKVPLSAQAVTILEHLKKITGKGRYLFPSVRTAQVPMSENSLNVALRSLGYSKDEMCAHGFRASASTLLNNSGNWHPDCIERQLSHMDRDAVRRAYNHAEYWDQRVSMVQSWADYLDRLKGSGQIIPLPHTQPATAS